MSWYIHETMQSETLYEMMGVVIVLQTVVAQIVFHIIPFKYLRLQMSDKELEKREKKKQKEKSKFVSHRGEDE